MSSPSEHRRYALLFLAALFSFVLSGCAGQLTMQGTVPVLREPDGGQGIAYANAHKYQEGRFSTTMLPLDGVPIGTIIAFYPFEGNEIGETWQYCDGSLITDKQSPAFGKRVPNLMDDRFVMGSTKSFGLSNGSNELKSDGIHDHGGVTWPAGRHDHGGATQGPDQNARANALKGKEVRSFDLPHHHKVVAEPDHFHVIGSDGAHNHGGDIRPRWFGVYYIVKIK